MNGIIKLLERVNISNLSLDVNDSYEEIFHKQTKNQKY